MKEKIIKILRKYSDFDEDDHKESQEFNSMTGDFEKLINVEVEKRIVEIAKDAWFEGMKQGIKFDREDRNIKAIMETEPRISFDDWLRSRLTNDSQKTEHTHQDAPQVPLKTEGGGE